MSAVSVLVIDCTTMGALPPTVTLPIFTAKDFLRDVMAAILPRRRQPSQTRARGGRAGARNRAEIGIMGPCPLVLSIPPAWARFARIAGAPCASACAPRV